MAAVESNSMTIVICQNPGLLSCSQTSLLYARVPVVRVCVCFYYLGAGVNLCAWVNEDTAGF